jgi:hypothetical protein
LLSPRANGYDITAQDTDWITVEDFATQEIIQCLRSDELLLSEQQMRNKCYHASRALHVGHRTAVPYSMIVKVLGGTKAAVCRRGKQHCVNGTSPMEAHAGLVAWEKSLLLSCENPRHSHAKFPPFSPRHSPPFSCKIRIDIYQCKETGRVVEALKVMG